MKQLLIMIVFLVATSSRLLAFRMYREAPTENTGHEAFIIFVLLSTVVLSIIVWYGKGKQSNIGDNRDNS